MARPLHCLLVEDSASDAGLIVRSLQKAGYEVVHERVETAGQMCAALEGQAWDVVIADYSLPEFGGPAALALLKEAGLDLPFLVVSGTIGEEAAVAMMRAGAHDYLLKGELGRLGPAVERELGTARMRRERRQAEEQLRASEARYRLIAENTSDMVWTFDLASARITYASPSVERCTGFSQEEVLAQTLDEMLTPESCARALSLLAERTAALEGGDESARVARSELEERCKDGSVLSTEVVATLLTDELGRVTGVVGASRDITERKKAEAALTESEKRAHFLADALDRCSQPFSTASLDGRLGMLNAAFCDMLGYSQDELRALQSMNDLTPPGLRGLTAPALERAGMDESPVRFEKEYIRKDGSRFPVEVVAHLVRDPEGAPSYYFAFFTDLTERRRAETALRESERRYRELFENAPLGIYRTTPDGRILLANPALLAMLGCGTMDELAGRNLEEEGYEPGYDRAWFKNTVERRGTIQDHEASWKRADGKTAYLREYAKVVRDSNGAVLYYDGIVEDITERKRIEDALRVSEERFRQVAEDAGVFVWEVDADGLYTYASPVVETILGYAPVELVGKLHYYDLFAPDGREELKAITTEAFSQRRPFSSFLNAAVSKDGRMVMLEASGVPLLDGTGNLLGYRGTDRDVTDRARATEELRKHRDHLEELVAERTAELENRRATLIDEMLARALAEQAYKRSEARLTLQFDCMPTGCILIGLDSRILNWNPAAERIFGYSTAEAVGAHAIDLVVPENLRAELRPNLDSHFKVTGTDIRVNENVTKDGRRIICEWTNTQVLDPDGVIRGVLCMVQDVTSRQQAEDALKRKTQDLEAFNRAMIGREKRSIELKEEINHLCGELGRPLAYPRVWDADKP